MTKNPKKPAKSPFHASGAESATVIASANISQPPPRHFPCPTRKLETQIAAVYPEEDKLMEEME